MAQGSPTAWGISTFAFAVASVFTACAQTGDVATEKVDHVESAIWTNGDFESGAANAAPPAPWAVGTFLNPGITVQNPQTVAGLNLGAGGVARTITLRSAAGPGTLNDPNLGATASLRYCRYGNQCAIVNGQGTGNNKNVNTLTQTMTVTNADVDPADGLVHVRFTIAPVLQNPAHTAAQQPCYFVQVTNVTTNTILYSDFNLSGAGIPWKTINGGTANEIDYTDWQLVDVAPGNAGLAVGHTVTAQFIAAGCQPGAHYGEVYVDGIGSTIPGLTVQGTGPAQANAGTNITYTLTYRNGAAIAESAVVTTLTTPANTTFQAITPPAGATCVTPAVGAAGVVTCTFTNPVPAGTRAAYTVTVGINAGAVGTITEAAYDIKSTQEPEPLLGPPIRTRIGCTLDNQCSAVQWCNETANQCTPKLPNGTIIPTDPPHVGPVLNGICTATAGALVCTSGVCDTSDNRCGFLNNDGPCTAANGGTVCRSGVCDPDLRCGYANGDGPCTAANGGTLCRSTACSTNGLCEPLGGCNVDADCSGGNWCNETTHTCTPKLANGIAMPNDPPHTLPTLNGVCSATAATLVCVAGVCDANDNRCGLLNNDGPCTVANGGVVCRSAVCDPDLKCGLANGDGPCTVANGGVRCRSTSCSVNGLCQALAGCNVDGDCSGGNWCNETSHICTAPLPNGTPVPTDPPHAGPVLNGTCTVAAGTLVCTSKVCDTADNRCGYANGDGPCTAVNGGVVCRSATCSANGLCMASGGCNVDADCSGGNWCNETSHVCTPKLPNGAPIPTDPPHAGPTLNGTCTAAAGTLVCTSGVCDTADNRCGYRNGDGPCTPANGGVVCRSGACSVNNLCEPAGGCNVDADCSAANWCNETSHACTPKIPNGSPVPTEPGHINPTLTGTCTAQAGTTCCVSGVCDTNDNNCGFLNNDGPCSAANGGTVCRSGVCDPDLKCGYANGDGPCTAANGGTVCRSGTCSANGLCVAPGACNVDADCSSGNWCNEVAHVCAPQLPNGTPLPTDPPHTNPTLNGTCTAPAATLVCVSGVCDTADNRCGYANGDGPCTAANGGVVCRSGRCGANNVCVAVGACNVDADCTGGDWCNITTHTCTPKVPNGGPVPNDPPHANPPLNGTCTAAAGALTCVSGVCDTDNLCGFKNGDGPCTGANGTAVCRSTICATTGPNTGLCEQCIDDSACATPTPACDAVKNTCGECTPKNPTMCTGNKPVCDAATDKCAPCDGDFGSGTKDACNDGTNPFCAPTGACTRCTKNADCTTGTHGGPICNTTTGSCGTGCKVDSDCKATDWCNDLTQPAMCGPKEPNGQPVPGGTCTPILGTRACISGACDTKDNKCGFANGDGPCATVQQCRIGKCDPAKVCVQCLGDSDCSATEFCKAGACTPKQSNGTGCTDPSQCTSSICDQDGACGGVVGTSCSSGMQCRSGTCTNSRCAGPVTFPDAGANNINGSLEGGGLSCSATQGGSSSNGGIVLWGLGIGFVTALARLRRTKR